MLCKQKLALGLTAFVLLYSIPMVSAQCSAYCTLTYSQTNRVTIASCVNTLSTGCIACDATYFDFIAGQCVAHNRYGEFLDNLYTIDATWLGDNAGLAYTATYYTETVLSFDGFTNNKWASKQMNVVNPHWAVRLRFFLAWDTTASSTIIYGVDEYYFTYDKQKVLYNSGFDIVTTGLLLHQSPVATVNFRVNSYTCCSGCCCSGGCPAISCNGCDVLIKDVMLFVSRCQDGCQLCNSSRCSQCGFDSRPSMTFLNHADGICYRFCPDTTFNSFDVLQNNEPFCDACDPLCLVCSGTSSSCSKCFPSGRNQSYWFNNTCLFACTNGYIEQFQGHICVCPTANFYQVFNVNGYPLNCLACAVQCLNCFGNTNLQCTACNTNYFLSYNTNNCESRCPTGQYSDNLTNKCYLCDTSCGSCTINSTNCIECFFVGSSIKYLLQSACVGTCPDGYASNNITRICELCTPYTYSYEGVCIRQCPLLYRSDYYNRSCLPLSNTDYKLQLNIVELSVTHDGKQLLFTLNLSDGLNATAMNNLFSFGYYDIAILMHESNISQSLNVSNIDLIDNSLMLYTTMPGLTAMDSFQVSGLILYSVHNISYNNSTSSYFLIDHPELLRQYYLYSCRNYFNAIAVPILFVILFLISLRIYGGYQILLELLRSIQLCGLIVYEIFPVEISLFYFIVGCNYANLQFLPNLYMIFKTPLSYTNFSSYLLATSDMDFIRFMGSILSFLVLWSTVLLAAKFLFRVQDPTWKYLTNFGMDITEIKILHSFWSSLIYAILNANSPTFTIYLTQGASYLFVGLIIGRHILNYRQHKHVSIGFIWRVLSTLLITLLPLAQLLLTLLIFVLACCTAFLYIYFQEHTICPDTTNQQELALYKSPLGSNKIDHIAYFFSLTLRITFLTLIPVVAAICIGCLILLKDTPLRAILIVSIVFALLLLFGGLILQFIRAYLSHLNRYLQLQSIDKLKVEYKKTYEPESFERETTKNILQDSAAVRKRSAEIDSAQLQLISAKGRYKQGDSSAKSSIRNDNTERQP